MLTHHSTVRQWCFNCANIEDPIRVLLDDISKTEGRVTITCHNQAWVSHWRDLQSQSLEQLLAHTAVSDLAKAFFHGQQWGADLISLSQRVTTEGPVQLAREDLSPDDRRKIEEALDTLESLESTGYEDVFAFSGELSLILGSDWWDATPTIMTPAFAYLNDIISGVQQVALATLDGN